ncbi:MAG: biopolymer transporter ExbD [Planctomycetota bacterium]|nr:biopolymer transporter ExbD [Planctomycetota bacterium]
MKALLEEENYDVPMTPMIDIVFQLLIFFLLATTIQEEERDLQINLASGSQGSERGSHAGSRLVISIRKDGTYALGGSTIEWTELRKRIIDAGRAKEKPLGTLRPDRDAPHGKVAQVYQLFAEAGIKVFEDFRYQVPAQAP